MAAFLENLWEAIFTPGPTPTLLIATNVSFGLLQLVLFAMLLSTYSIHFFVLSLISAGLWASINWFAREVQAEQERVRAEKAAAEGSAGTVAGKEPVEAEASQDAGERIGRASALKDAGARRRLAESTDSEWEKVERSAED